MHTYTHTQTHTHTYTHTQRASLKKHTRTLHREDYKATLTDGAHVRLTYTETEGTGDGQASKQITSDLLYTDKNNNGGVIPTCKSYRERKNNR